jgi:hypothetical protein
MKQLFLNIAEWLIYQLFFLFLKVGCWINYLVDKFRGEDNV